MNKRSLHHALRRIRPIKPWYLLAATLACGVVAVFALRSNYTHMVRLRTAVYQADQQNGNVVLALQNLRAYVGAHMNTNLDKGDGVYPPIQLKYTYERLQQAEHDRVANASSAIYTDAQHYCEAQNPTGFSGRTRVPCIEQYVKDHGVSEHTIPDAMYKFDFVSPRWSPDLAGWMLGLACLLLGLTAVRFLLGWWLRRVAE